MLEVFCDASIAKDGLTGVSFVIKNDGVTEVTLTKKEKHTDIQNAELSAVLNALNYLISKKEYMKHNIKVYSDNQNIVNYFNKEIKKVKSMTPELKVLLNNTRTKIGSLDIKIEWLPRKNNCADLFSRISVQKNKVLSYNNREYIVPEDTEVLLPLEMVKVSKLLKTSIPTQIKLQTIKEFYEFNGYFDKPLYLKKDNNLIDNYMRYLVAKQSNISVVPVRYFS